MIPGKDQEPFVSGAPAPREGMRAVFGEAHFFLIIITRAG